MNDTLRETLIRQLRRDEGEQLSAYPDHLGYLTIGVGRLIDKRKGGGISAEESAYLLGNDIDRVQRGLAAALPWFEGLNEARKGALLNMAFQMGVEGLLEFKKTLAAVRDERFAEAETLALQSRWAQQTPNRAHRIARQLATGEWQ